MKKISPSLKEYLKSQSPGSWTTEGFPMPEPFAVALEQVEAARTRRLEGASITHATRWQRIRFEVKQFADYLNQTYFRGLGFLSVATAVKLLLLASYLGTYCTPLLCVLVVQHWHRVKFQGEGPPGHYSAGLIAFTAFVAASNSHSIYRIFTAKGMNAKYLYVFPVAIGICTTLIYGVYMVFNP